MTACRAGEREGGGRHSRFTGIGGSDYRWFQRTPRILPTPLELRLAAPGPPAAPRLYVTFPAHSFSRFPNWCRPCFL